MIQALVAKIDRLLESNLALRVQERAVIEENKFSALKKGLDGNFIDFPHRRAAPTRVLILEMLDFVDDVVDDLGTRDEIDFVRALGRHRRHRRRPADRGARSDARPARGGGPAGGRDPARLVDSKP